ncbi:SDR family NAD(P)-dependent oxidoreductase [Halopseudomonas pelagia]|uniref:3-oxoacyl-ACP reductase FabG n=1 Tax=Halopseudomonas pelagia TaxID=553151 RepID=A0AA91Z7S2_9GAMM|nr:3-oxoacyl-ACP reductase family protein [Halopseudomonas pelagia]PCD01192.1 oxidoreductase [Halopseudomonas pelagia]QFY58813.1 3-oxoacyl-ACP reductase FabG [Halopseudomonas pelagia]
MQEETSFSLSRRKILIGASIGAAALAAPSIAGAQTTSAGPKTEDPLAHDLTGKRALVTGASRGIGAGIALALADRGADVVITYLQSTDMAAEIVRIIESKGRRALAVQADSGDPAAVRRSIDETVKTLGGLDILVNNVGIARSAPLEEMTFADIDDLLSVNSRAAVLASQAAIPHLKDGARIITIGSCLAERVPYPNLTVYSMSKSALLAFTRGLARELGPRNITVNLIQPGPIDTDQNPADGDWAEANTRLTALGRYGNPSDIAAAVSFLASPAAQFMTGSVMTVDAGFNA